MVDTVNARTDIPVMPRPTDDPTGGLARAAAERAARITRYLTIKAASGEGAAHRDMTARLIAAGGETCAIQDARLNGDRLYPARCGNPGTYVHTPGWSGVACPGHVTHLSRP